jgi:hypothetical protein
MIARYAERRRRFSRHQMTFGDRNGGLVYSHALQRHGWAVLDLRLPTFSGMRSNEKDKACTPYQGELSPVALCC